MVPREMVMPLDGRLIINGARVQTNLALASINPATLESLGEVCLASELECRRAIRSAHQALPVWRAFPMAEKKAIFRRAMEILLRRSGEVAERVTREKGSPISEALNVDVFTGLELLDYYCHDLRSIGSPRKTRLHVPLFAHKRNRFVFEPLGVTLIITPWNFPFVIPFNDTLSCLAAGNTVVLRPSSTTPFTGLVIGEILTEAGLPPGVLNVVNTRSAQAESMITDPIVQTVLFTGSVAVGKRVMELASRNLTHVILELGGKDPMIVLDDADLQKAARGAVWAGFMNTGQSCASIERIYVDRRVAVEFLDRVVALAAKLRVGDPLNPDIDIGPMTTAGQLDLVVEHLADARARGARILCGGDKPRELAGYFLTPTVLDRIDHSMKIMREETFGPVLPVMAFEGLEDAVALANDSEYGLTASVWTRSRAKAEWLADRLEAGTITTNDHMFSFTDPKAIWGGVKKTGVGRSHGPYGLLEVSNIKFVSMDFDRRRTQLWWYPYSAPKRRIMEKAIVFLHHPKRIKRFGALLSLLPQWGEIRASLSLRNFLRIGGRMFRP